RGRPESMGRSSLSNSIPPGNLCVGVPHPVLRCAASTHHSVGRSSLTVEGLMFRPRSELSHPVSRRRFFGGAVAGAAAMLSTSHTAWADSDDRPNDPFILLLTGLYHPAPQLPDLGL